MKKEKNSGLEEWIADTDKEKNDKEMPSLLERETDTDSELDSSTADDVKLNNKEEVKTAWNKSAIREVDLERALYKWYESFGCESKDISSESKTVVPSLRQLIKKAKSLGEKLNCSDMLASTVTKSWILEWQKRCRIPRKADGDDDGDNLSAFLDDSKNEKKPFEEEKKMECLEPIKQRLKKRRLKKEDNEIFAKVESNKEDGEIMGQSEDLRQILSVDTGQEQEIFLQEPLQNYAIEGQQDFGNDQIYFAFSFEFNWTSLPDKTWKMHTENSVWLLMAANRSGRHRTRILVTGHEWRPQCLKYVNMLSQPVVYAGGGKGVLTPDLFSWWFLKEFLPAAESLNSEFTLFAEDRWVNLKSMEVTNSRNVRIVSVSESDILDWDLIYAEFKTRFTTFLLKNLANTTESLSPNSLAEYLKEFSLKDAFPLFHKSWLSIRSESFQRLSEIKLAGMGGERKYSADVTPDVGTENSLLNFSKGEVNKSESEFKSMNLTANGKDEKKETLRLALTAKQNVAPNHLQEDRLLLLELQWLVHDIGLEVTDEDMLAWVLEKKTMNGELIKVEEAEFTFDDAECPVKAIEAADCLKKALLWMETQPIDSNLLMVVRDIMDLAKQASKMGLAPPHPGAPLHFFCHNGDHLTNPPPAHMGIPPYHLDAKGTGAMGEYWRGLSLGGLSIRPPSSGPSGSPVPPHPAFSPQDWKRLGPLLAASGLSRTPMYSFPAGSTYPYPMLSPEMSQVPATWHAPGMYPISAGAGFRSSYTPSLPISSTTLPSDFYRFSPTSLLPGHPGLSPHGHHSLSSHPAIVTPGPKQELGHHTQSDHNHRSSSLDHKNSSSSHHSTQDSKTQDSSSQNDKKKPHIKKPLNAFMLYMKEMRAKVVAECTLKESAAINQILGRRWHALGREEQAKYYELARRERQLHMQLYPDWSSRANSSRGKKRKRKQETNDGGNNMKKCRARYGLDQQSQWCKPCRRKKKCIRYLESGEERDGNQSEDNLGSCGSVGEARTPPDDDESLPHSLSSPGGLSGLSSLTSPSMILPSPSTSLASPSVSLASPCMSLQSPLTPPTFDMKPIMPIALPPLNRNPVGTNPHDVNNPLSVNQLTGKCIKSEPKEQSRPISVT